MNTLSKNITLFTALSLATIVNAQNNYDDDIYYSPSKDIHVATKAPEQTQPAPASNIPAAIDYSNQEQNTGVDNNATKQNDPGNSQTKQSYYDDSFNADNYYDYEYAARLRRFHHGCGNYGYYDNYYTNSYWYNYNPAYWGSSIYLGYSWWGPSFYSYSYYPGVNWGWGYGAGICWGNNYYNPWSYGYGWGHPGYGYGGGYWNGYHNGYWAGYNNGYNNYFNSYDQNSYYGSRGNTSYGARGGSANGTNGKQQVLPKTLGEKYIEAKGIEGKTHSTTLVNDNGFTPSNPTHSVTPGGLNGLNNVSGKKTNITQSPTIYSDHSTGFGTGIGNTDINSSKPLEKPNPLINEGNVGTNNPVKPTVNVSGANRNNNTSVIKESKPDILFDDYNPVVKPQEPVMNTAPATKFENAPKDLYNGGTKNYNNRTDAPKSNGNYNPAPVQNHNSNINENKSGGNHSEGNGAGGGNWGNRSNGGNNPAGGGGGRSGGGNSGGGGRSGGNSGGNHSGGRR